MKCKLTGCIGHVKSEVYKIGLANGLTWNIGSEESLKPWLNQMAAILELKKGDAESNLPQIFFSRTNRENLQEEKPHMSDALPSSGWERHILKSVCLWSHHNIQDIFIEIETRHNNDTDSLANMSLSLRFLYREGQKVGSLPLHGALIELDGKGAILAGTGGAGKSSSCSRLPSPWKILSDDEVLLVKNEEKVCQAHPFPTWSDLIFRGLKKSWNVEYHVPVQALFFIEQAEEDEIVSLGEGAATVHIFNSASQASFIDFEKDAQRATYLRKQIFDNACALAKAVPSYTLKISLTGRFWEKIEALLEKQVK